MPVLGYKSYSELVTPETNFNDPRLAYCPLNIQYLMLPWDPITNSIKSQMGPKQVDMVSKAFRAKFEDWQRSKECGRVRAILESATLPGPITKIVAFACASLYKNRVRASCYQHALMLTVKEILEDRQHESVQCFAQDPDYTDGDKAVLGSEGIVVLDDPRAFLEVDNQSVVISRGANICVRQIVGDIARPAMMMWDTVMSEKKAPRRWLDPRELFKSFTMEAPGELEAGV